MGQMFDFCLFVHFQLDKMVGGLGGGGKGRRGYGPGHMVRPSSVGDFNEMEEENWSINQMPDHEVPEEFEKMLENMNLSKVRKQRDWLILDQIRS